MHSYIDAKMEAISIPILCCQLSTIWLLMSLFTTTEGQSCCKRFYFFFSFFICLNFFTLFSPRLWLSGQTDHQQQQKQNWSVLFFFNFLRLSFLLSAKFKPTTIELWATTLSKIVIHSVTRLGDLLNFGQLFKARGKNYFPQITHIFRQFL